MWKFSHASRRERTISPSVIVSALFSICHREERSDVTIYGVPSSKANCIAPHVAPAGLLRMTGVEEKERHEGEGLGEMPDHSGQSMLKSLQAGLTATMSAIFLMRL